LIVKTKGSPTNQQHTNQSMKKKTLSICTIVSKNYLPYARVVAESFLEHNKGDVFVLLVDRVDGYFEPSMEKFELIEIEELRDMVPEFDKFCFQYSILELNTAIKPYLLEYLFKTRGMEKLIYFDPDILVTNNLDELSKLLDKNEVVLTPHLTAPIEDDFSPGEVDILLAGTYNLGFLALRNTANTLELVQWWQKRLHNRCIVDHANGIFVDQKWMDLVPGFYDDVFLLREPGYNVAYWNYHCRDVRVEGNEISVNNKPSYFFHFSGLNPENLNPISKHQNRFTLKHLENMRPLFELYRDKVLSHGWEETKNWPYFLATFDNGVKIPDAARRLFLELGDKAEQFGDPLKTKGKNSFFSWLNQPEKPTVPEISRLLYKLHAMRQEIRGIYPYILGPDKETFLSWLMTYGKKAYSIDDRFLTYLTENKGGPTKFSFRTYLYRAQIHASALAAKVLLPVFKKNKKAMDFLIKAHDKVNMFFLGKNLSSGAGSSKDHITGSRGINIMGYIQSESGMGEAIRSEIRSLETIKYPFAMVNLSSKSRQKDNTYKYFTEDNPYCFNLVHANADQVLNVCNEKGREFFKDKYNIGYWIWELSVFPEEWIERFKLFDEIWTASNFCLDALSKVSTVPVIRMPLSIEIKNIKKLNRDHFGLNNKAIIFLFTFDFLSFFERKNPLAVIEAFKAAFSGDDNVQLVLKCSNSKNNQQAREIMDEAARGLNIKFIDTYLDKDELYALFSLCDCYVSLHRSEGFGLTIAEAMYLEKPVIATAYSSNMDFMNLNNSLPVKYKLVEIEQDIGPYKKGCRWAEPDIGHAAEQMRLVYEKREWAVELGKRASEDIKAQLSPLAVGKRMSERLEYISIKFGISG